MRAFIPVWLGLLVITGCGPHYPTEAERRKDFGDSFIYRGAPFRCIYVGLNTNEAALFTDRFWRFASQHDIHRPKKHYKAYSGPPLATCKNNHVSVFEQVADTTHIKALHDKFAGPIDQEQLSWEAGFWTDEYWPTNASRIRRNGREILAPLSGVVNIAPNDTNYSLRDFKRLSENWTTNLQAAFPDRAVRVVSYDGD